MMTVCRVQVTDPYRQTVLVCCAISAICYTTGEAVVWALLSYSAASAKSLLHQKAVLSDLKGLFPHCSWLRPELESTSWAPMHS